MGRPAGYQWQPLGLDSDPVPGDPAQITQEAQHLASVAAEITSQVAALRKIGSDGTEVGEHADKIRSQANSLAGQLDKLVGRYTKVSAALSGWVPELEQAQAMSLQALNQAEGPYQKLHQTVVLPSGPHLTAQQKQSVQDYHNSMQQAQAQLADAQALLTKATTLRDDSGNHYANVINNACNDGMRDHSSLFGSIFGFFSGVFDWVAGHWSQILADVCTVLEVVATILAIAAFIIAQFIPGLNVLVDGVLLVDLLVAGGMILTGVALAGRIALAATHHGSWMDVAIDAFALLTFGTGRIAGAVARGLLPGAEAASKLAMTGEALTEFAEGTGKGAEMARFADLEGDDAVTMIQKLAPKLASKITEGAELKGFAKVMMNIGGFGKDEQTYATLIRIGERFTTPISDLSRYTTIAKALSGVAGISTATSGVTGITATVLNGWATNYLGNWDPAGTHPWYYKHVEMRTGAPAGG
jgi:hypothetical protein